MFKHLVEGIFRSPLTETAPPIDDSALDELAKRLQEVSRKRLGRSLSFRQVDAGSCNGCELEIRALTNAFYDLERFGFHFVASPRHACSVIWSSWGGATWALYPRHEYCALTSMFDLLRRPSLSARRT